MHELFDTSKFISWVNARDPDEKYCFCDNYDCLISRYFKDHGETSVSVDSERVYFHELTIELPDFWNIIAGGAARPNDGHEIVLENNETNCAGAQTRIIELQELGYL